MPSPATQDLRAGDLVAVALPPGQDWAGILGKVWEAGAALFPVDRRLPPSQARDLMDRAVPTVVVDADGWHRPGSGRPVGDGVALVVHTSGTGGVPKLVLFDRPAIDAAVASSTLALDASPHDRWLCCLPLAHVGGLLVLLRSVLLGAPVTVHPRFDPRAVAAEADAAFVSLVPTMLVRLLDADADLSHFRAILVGGAAVPAWVADRARAEGANVIETYGLTESCGGVVYDGRPLPGTEVRIDGNGGIQLRGPTVMRGYLDDPEATARAFTDGGWLRAEDGGWIDGQGMLRVAGRLDDLINTGGEKVWPEEVEAVLHDHPGIVDVAIVGRPDPEWGQRVVAYLVPADPTAPLSLEALRDYVALSLPRHMAPRQLILVPEGLPRTASGKVRRAALA
ncbi:MAG TPA: class I adenylate-forming enzyme family protein [Actinomycetota bacterium]|nr:class I adenylate-forming enzyme family protein [Actinomycetota bacterium]